MTSLCDDSDYPEEISWIWWEKLVHFSTEGKSERTAAYLKKGKSVTTQFKFLIQNSVSFLWNKMIYFIKWNNNYETVGRIKTDKYWQFLNISPQIPD